MKIGLLASRPHYLEHLAPIWAGLPDDLKGTYRPPETMGLRNTWPDPDVTLVASFEDMQYVTGPIIYVEHGAGQTYQGINVGNYSGGTGRDRCILFIVPNDTCADKNDAADPRTPNAVVGVPKLDSRHTAMLGQPLCRPMPEHPRVAVTFHWPCKVLPETDTALPYYREILPELGRTFDMLGHAHPRWLASLRHVYNLSDISYTSDPWRVLDEADILVADTTSLAYEFSSLGKPTVWLNTPEYRRDVHHGLRWWDNIPGVQVDSPDDLVQAIQIAHRQGQTMAWAEQRRDLTKQVYAHTDGTATARAIEAILNVTGS